MRLQPLRNLGGWSPSRNRVCAGLSRLHPLSKAFASKFRGTRYSYAIVIPNGFIGEESAFGGKTADSCYDSTDPQPQSSSGVSLSQCRNCHSEARSVRARNLLFWCQSRFLTDRSVRNDNIKNDGLTKLTHYP